MIHIHLVIQSQELAEILVHVLTGASPTLGVPCPVTGVPEADGRYQLDGMNNWRLHRVQEGIHAVHYRYAPEREKVLAEYLHTQFGWHTELV